MYSVTIYSTLCDSVTIYSTLCDSVTIYSTLCDSVTIYSTLCDSVTIYSTLCDSVTIYSTLCDIVTINRIFNSYSLSPLFQLYMMRTMLESLLSEKAGQKKSLRAELHQPSIHELEHFHRNSYFFTHILNFESKLRPLN